LSPAVSPKETEKKNAKDRQADDGIEPVSLRGEADCCKGDPNERIDQQQDNTDHDQAAAMADGLQTNRSLKHRNGVLKILRLSAEEMIAGRHSLVGRNEPNQAGPHDGRGHQDSREHHPSQRVLQLRVVH
jgi:hypothetical protein